MPLMEKYQSQRPSILTDQNQEVIMAAKKILMLVGDFVEDYEAMVPFQALLMVGHTVHNL